MNRGRCGLSCPEAVLGGGEAVERVTGDGLAARLCGFGVERGEARVAAGDTDPKILGGRAERVVPGAGAVPGDYPRELRGSV